MRSAEPMRALLLTLLLASGTLASLAPEARAQDPGNISGGPPVCFVRDPGKEPGFMGVCAGRPDSPDYLQGQDVTLVLPHFQGSTPWVSVKCLTSCHNHTDTYYARWTGDFQRPLVFPWDFNQPGPDGDGGNAPLDRVPRYNGTWEVRVLVPGPPIVRSFNVWIATFFLSPGHVVGGGELHEISAARFDPGHKAFLRVERLSPENEWEAIYEKPDAASDARGFVRGYWRVEKSEATHAVQCAQLHAVCYRLVVAGVGKEPEVVPIPLGPATIRLSPFGYVGTNPGGQPRILQRTESALTAGILAYPGGVSQAGPALTPEDLSGITHREGLRVAVEKVNVTPEGIQTTTQLDEIRWKFTPGRYRWEAEWTVPKDFPVDPTCAFPGCFVRLRLLAAQDIHGNRIEERILGNYTLTKASLRPDLAEAPRELARASEGRVALQIRYHNGSALTDKDNATPLKGCFKRAGTLGQDSCGDDEAIQAKFEDGLWVFRAHYPRDYPNLDAHRFILQANRTEDRWGNLVTWLPNLEFPLVAGSPLVQFSTIMRGRAVETLERGATINLQALIAFEDGSAFNSSISPYPRGLLPANLTKRGPEGDVVSRTPFNFTESDSRKGRWSATLQLTRDDTLTPLGTWTFEFDIRDNLTVPNLNVTSFERTLVAAPMRLETTYRPASTYQTGSEVRWSFRLWYDTAPGEEPRAVPPEALGRGVSAQVYRWDEARQSPVGEPLSGLLVPTYAPTTRDYLLTYHVPEHLFSGSYVFVLAGGDTHGNRLAQDAFSRSFATQAPHVDRTVLNPPAPTVRRGEEAVAVFLAQTGDVGLDGTGRPTIRLERLDPMSLAWERVPGVADLRRAGLDSPDHVGIFPVSTTTTIGTYRLVLEGRDARFRDFTTPTSNFTIEAARVERGLVSLPPEGALKGELIGFTLERQEGDRVVRIEILHNGRTPPFTLPPPTMMTTPQHVNVSWAIPYEAPSGNYSARVRGRDVYGNEIIAQTPPVDIQPAQLQGRILGQPVRVVERAEEISMLFAITFPNGAYYVAQENPRVGVLGASGFVEDAKLERQGLTYTAKWTPAPQVALGDYQFEISGSGVGGNAFPTLRSAPFRVLPGEVTRTPTQDAPPESDRLVRIPFSIPALPGDHDLGFALEYYGPTVDVRDVLFETRAPTTTTPLSHWTDPDAARHVANFSTNVQTPQGAYRFRATGFDAHGNQLHAASKPFVLRQTGVGVSLDPQPPDSALQPGQPLTISFVASYRTGMIMDNTRGTPSVRLLYNGVPDERLPEVVYRDSRWHVTWTAPDSLAPGKYEFSIGGSDIGGNPIAGTVTRPIQWEAPLKESVSRVIFGKEIPSVGLPSALVALALIALALRKRG